MCHLYATAHVGQLAGVVWTGESASSEAGRLSDVTFIKCIYKYTNWAQCAEVQLKFYQGFLCPFNAVTGSDKIPSEDFYRSFITRIRKAS